MSKYTFNPPEEELISYYLNNKITEKDDPQGKLINEVNICHYEPANLPELAKIKSSHTWYFISPVEKFGRLNRTKRASKSGHWKITGNSRTVKDTNGNPIGSKKFLVFQENKASSSSSVLNITRQPRKSNWIIHEFHSFLHHPKKDAFVLCKLMKKTSPRESAVISENLPVILDQSLASDLLLTNTSQIENKRIVEADYGGDYCDDLDDLLPEFHCVDHFHYDQFHSGFTDIFESLEGGEWSSLNLGERGHLYEPNTTETFNVRQLTTYIRAGALGFSPVS